MIALQNIMLHSKVSKMKNLQALFLLLAIHAVLSTQNSNDAKRLTQDALSENKLQESAIGTKLVKLRDSVEINRRILQKLDSPIETTFGVKSYSKTSLERFKPNILRNSHLNHNKNNSIDLIKKTTLQLNKTMEKNAKLPNEMSFKTDLDSFTTRYAKARSNGTNLTKTNIKQLPKINLKRDLDAKTLKTKIVPNKSQKSNFKPNYGTKTVQIEDKPGLNEIITNEIGEDVTRGTMKRAIGRNLETMEDDVPTIKGLIEIPEIAKSESLTIKGTIEIPDADINHNPKVNRYKTKPNIANLEGRTIKGTFEIPDEILSANIDNTAHEAAQGFGSIIKGSIEIPADLDQNLNGKEPYIKGVIEIEDSETQKRLVKKPPKAKTYSNSNVELDHQEIEKDGQYGNPGVEWANNGDDSDYNDPGATDYQFEPKPIPIVSTIVDIKNEDVGNVEEQNNDENLAIHDTNQASDDEGTLAADDYENGAADERAGEDITVEKDAINNDDSNNELTTRDSKDDVGDDEVDMEQYKADCPTQCPSRDVMVCARCQHGVYKTFLSVCHMRMFQCTHKEETLELVSRQACVLSAPYISEHPRMQPKGRITEPSDQDHVLRYLRCRESGKLGKNSRCLFDDHDKIKLNRAIEPVTKETIIEY